ncbi:receptor-type guanylate cyclase gcy-28-like [Ruditapes philippinarum]|uniref:receptor-type guanylate cyclase gcy-28-like n=1 Tax=Ruditapes philippinarum TaxID=129788 RepID=UPI00295C1A5D|nr:receptor-type guanylate cyclase gcy-28-like [Ruditapes philippinarum]
MKNYLGIVNNFVGAFHDAVVLYALALNETIEAGQPISNGTAVTHRMWDRTFNGITGTVAIDENGDRLMDYSLLDMDPHTGQYQVVANYYGKSKQVEFVPGKQIHFGADNDEPSTDTKQNKSDKQQGISEMLEELQKSFAKVTAAVEEHRIKLAAITKLIDEE